MHFVLYSKDNENPYTEKYRVGILVFVRYLVVKVLLLYKLTHVASPLLLYHFRIASEQSLRKS